MTQRLYWAVNIWGKFQYAQWKCCDNVWEMIFKTDWFPVCPDCRAKGIPWDFRKTDGI